MLDKPALNEAIAVAESMNDDPMIVELVRQSYFWDHERASLVETGREEERERIIANLREMGLSEDLIKNAIKQNF